MDSEAISYHNKELSSYFEVLRDPGGQWQLAEVIAQQALFMPLQGGFAEGFSKDVFWLRLSVVHFKGEAGRWWLLIHPAFIDQLHWYSPQPDGSYTRWQAGSQVPLKQRPLAIPQAVFPVNPAEQVQTYYLRVQSNTTLTLDFSLWTADSFAQHVVASHFMHGMFFGLLVLITIYSLMMIGWVKQAFFWYAVAFITAYGIVHLMFKGYDQAFIYPQTPWFSDHLIGIIVIVGLAVQIILVVSYFRPATYYPRLTRSLEGVVTLYVLLLLLSLLGLYPHINHLVHLVSVIAQFLLFALMLLMLRIEPAKALLFLLVFLPTLTTIFLHILRNIGVLPVNFWTSALWWPMAVLQVIFLVLAAMYWSVQEQRRLRASEERAQSERDLLNLVAHELRNPLSIITTAVTNLQLRTQATLPELQPRYERIHTALARLDILMGTALLSEQLGETMIKLNVQPITPTALVDYVLELFHFNAEKYQLQCEISEAVEVMHVDIQWFTLALLNLLDNAVKYTPAGGHIRLRIDAPETAWVRIRLSDTGIGIPKEARAQLFERFYRGANARPLTKIKGLGLGLFLVQQVVIKHGGYIEIDSTVDKGSEFFVYLPQNPSPPALSD
ncbi:sensor histidine kinase [Thiorhodospira sibirica]|uniref:sensor histidine kinase n=1 Tax=Thiorhodospira sibirica TaxID=154347 RepID=UPI00022C0B74|nr:sensor histidine kinase [Thiorhodospira sibirica]